VDVFLIRHAEAIDEAPRHLTAKGRAQATSLGERLRWFDCLPTHVWTSPLERAVETAELVARAVNAMVTVDIVRGLARGEAVSILAAVRDLPADAIVVVVGHEPMLSTLAGMLVGEPGFAGLAKAEAVRIVDGRLRWRCCYDAEAPSR
jgi:phosphohistidine phosphatase